MFQGLWGGVSQSVGQSIGLVSSIYGNQSGLTQQQLQAQTYQASLNAKQQQEKLKTYTIIAILIVFVVAIIIITKKK